MRTYVVLNMFLFIITEIQNCSIPSQTMHVCVNKNCEQDFFPSNQNPREPRDPCLLEVDANGLDDVWYAHVEKEPGRRSLHRLVSEAVPVDEIADRELAACCVGTRYGPPSGILSYPIAGGV